MAVSLETRIPFLDHRLYEFAWRCPLNYKIHKKNGKKILKNLLYRYVPENLIERPKMGFGIPIGEWLRGPLREWASALLDVDKLQREGVFKVDFVTKKWKNHLQNVGDNSGFLWNILMYQLWYSSLK
jgi:asparagine synthase (glutamine-hydrolysing)